MRLKILGGEKRVYLYPRHPRVWKSRNVPRLVAVKREEPCLSRRQNDITSCGSDNEFTCLRPQSPNVPRKTVLKRDDELRIFRISFVIFRKITKLIYHKKGSSPIWEISYINVSLERYIVIFNINLRTFILRVLLNLQRVLQMLLLTYPLSACKHRLPSSNSNYARMQLHLLHV